MLVLALGQMNTMQKKDVVHLRPHQDMIEAGFDGKILELIHAPAVVHLPLFPPKGDAFGNSWEVDIRDFGPSPVTVVGKSGFSVQIGVGQMVRIYSNGARYSLTANGNR
jgi:hypothetical protein